MKGLITWAFCNYKYSRWCAARLLQKWGDIVDGSAVFFGISEEATSLFIFIYCFLSHFILTLCILYYLLKIFSSLLLLRLFSFKSQLYLIVWPSAKLFFSQLVSTLKQKGSNEYLYKEYLCQCVVSKKKNKIKNTDVRKNIYPEAEF